MKYVQDYCGGVGLWYDPNCSVELNHDELHCGPDYGNGPEHYPGNLGDVQASIHVVAYWIGSSGLSPWAYRKHSTCWGIGPAGQKDGVLPLCVTPATLKPSSPC